MSKPAPTNRNTWIGFLVTSFVVLGLAGIFTTYALPMPVEAVLHGEHPPALDPALRQALHEQDLLAARLRWLVGLVTIAAALFGAAILGAAARPQR
jgi:hypothetical protein